MSEMDEAAYQDALRNTPDPCSTRVFIEHYERAKQRNHTRAIEKIEALDSLHGCVRRDDVLAILKGSEYENFRYCWKL